MIRACYIFLVLAASVMIETKLGSLGVVIPLAAMSVYYFSMMQGWRIGLALGFAAGLAVDMLYGREVPVSTLGFMAVSGVTVFWLLKGETKDYLLHVVPGLLTGLVAVIPVVALYWKDMMLGGVEDILSVPLSSVVSAAVILPVLIFCLDAVSEWLGMELYRNARENIEERMQ